MSKYNIDIKPVQLVWVVVWHSKMITLILLLLLVYYLYLLRYIHILKLFPKNTFFRRICSKRPNCLLGLWVSGVPGISIKNTHKWYSPRVYPKRFLQYPSWHSTSWYTHFSKYIKFHLCKNVVTYCRLWNPISYFTWEP